MISVTAAILEREGLVLAARRKQGKHLAGYWEFPGGKVETGESYEACLARELDEEFGVTVKVGSFFRQSIFKYDGKTIRLMAYLVTHISGEFIPVEHDKLIWLPIDELHTLKWAPADIPIVESYQQSKN